jgi:hypothetical protein
MYHMYHFNRAECLQHYHKRSNVESTFSMIKAKFRDHVRSKTDVAMKNEVLCKIICHNICCLIQESHELGIDTAFWAETSPAQEPTKGRARRADGSVAKASPSRAGRA